MSVIYTTKIIFKRNSHVAIDNCVGIVYNDNDRAHHASGGCLIVLRTTVGLFVLKELTIELKNALCRKNL